MTAPTLKYVGAGFRHGQVLVLGADGYPIENSSGKELVYEGLAIERGRELMITPPDPRTVAHKGDDVVFALQMLPPDTALTATYKTALEDLELEEALTGNLAVTVGEINLINGMTDLMGFENQVAIVAQQAGQPAGKGQSDLGIAGWNNIIFPKAWMVPKQSGMAEDNNPYEKNFSVIPTMSTKYPWGLAMTALADGCLSAYFQKGNSQYPMWIANFKGDGSTLVFTLNTAYNAVSTSKMALFVDGVLTSAGVTLAVDDITFNAAPDDDANITVVYEVAGIP